VLAGRERGLRGVEVPIVRRGDANDIHARVQELLNRVAAVEALKRSNALRGAATISFRASAGSRRHGRERRPADAERWIVEPPARSGFKKRAIGLVKDHPHADHASAQNVCVTARRHRGDGRGDGHG
jgi:hypothetical protein